MKKNYVFIGLIVFVVVGFQLLLSNTELFRHLELMSYDLRAQMTFDNGLFGKKFNRADRDIVIVAIDNYTKKQLTKNPPEEYGNWPWHRDAWNNIIDFIEQGEPKAVLFDMVFENVNENPWHDRRFAQTLRKYDNIVLGTYLDSPKGKDNAFTQSVDTAQNDYLPTSRPLDVTTDSKKLEDAITYYVNAPVHNIYTESNSVGVVNKLLDDDAVVRRTQPIFKLVKNGQTYYMPSLSFAGFLKYMGEGDKIQIKDDKIYYKDRVIPVDSKGIVNINWHSLNHSYSYVSLSRIILNKGRKRDLKPEFFKNKLVIIGKTATGSRVDLSSIIDDSYTSPEANAVALDNFINDTKIGDKQARKFVNEIPKPVQILITAVACLFIIFIGLISKSAFIGCINGALTVLLYVFFCFWLFVNPNSRVLVPIVVPLYYLTVTSGIVFAFRFYKEVTKKHSIMSVFGKFVSPKVLNTVMKNPEKVTLKNTKKKISVLFCDVKDFSSLSEKHNPEKLVENLNELFKEIVNIIFENSGTVDKFIGDCIMAYWGDFECEENDAYLAVKTALQIKKKVNELKIANTKEGKIVFDVKIGINTGDAILGLAGTERIMSYTAMGDAVNVASRLESSCSTLKREILISKSTFDEAKDKIVALEVGEIKVKGKYKTVNVYEPIGLVGELEEQKEAQEPTLPEISEETNTTETEND